MADADEGLAPCTPTPVPTQRKKLLIRLLHALVQHSWLLCMLLTVLGLCMPLFLPAFDRPVKFDESALLVGGASPSVRSSGALQSGLQLARSLSEQQHGQHRAPLLTVLQHMLRMGLDVSCSFALPLSTATSLDCRDLEQQLRIRNGSVAEQGRGGVTDGGPCINLHGVLRARQTDGKEALMLVTPVNLTQGESAGDLLSPGSFLLLAGAATAMHHLQGLQWLARDVVWVVPDAQCGSTASLEHWAAHYQSPDAWATSFSRAGVLQQALILEVDGLDLEGIQVLVEGRNGQLPKLDNYNLLRVSSYVFPDLRVQPLHELALLRSVLEHWGQEVPPALVAYTKRLAALLSFMARQAAGLPAASHAALKPLMVDAATARFTAKQVMPDSQPASGSPDSHPAFSERATQLAEYVEVVLRCLNNLDERFHHSFFLYLMSSSDRFVPVEVYIIPLAALIGVLVLKAAGQHNAMQQRQRKQMIQERQHTSQKLWAPGVATTALFVSVSVSVGWCLRHSVCHTSATRMDGSQAQPGSVGQLAESAALVVCSVLVALTLGSELVQLATGRQSAPARPREDICRDQACPPGTSAHPTRSETHLHTGGTHPDLTETHLDPDGKHPGIGTHPDPTETHLRTSRGITGTHRHHAEPHPDLQAARRVTLLISASMILAAMANVNWAAAYAVAASLAMVVAITPMDVGSINATTAVKAVGMSRTCAASRSSCTSTMFKLFTAGCAAMSLMFLAVMVLPQFAIRHRISGVALVHHVVCATSEQTWLVLWGAFVPSFLFEVIVVLST